MRIAVVNDQRLAVEALQRAVRGAGHAVAWVARDGEEAARKAAADRPDLILMDLVMPVLDGAAATRRIMRESPCPILVVTATVSGNYGLVYEALGAGAVDAVATPTLGLDGNLGGADALAAKIAQIARKVKCAGPAASGLYAALAAPAVAPLLAVGASTGGPHAMAELLAELPADFPAAVLLVQHIEAEFAGGLADWLRPKGQLPVRLAAPGDTPAPGQVLVAGRNDHLVLRPDGTLAYTPDPTGTPFRPNVDVFFESLLPHRPGVAVLLTGMGRDGAAGLLKLRRAGWATYAQSEASCAVFGMPDAAAKLGAAQFVLTPREIGAAVSRPGPT